MYACNNDAHIPKYFIEMN